MKIPAIKGKIGDTVYYTANLTFQQVNQLIKLRVLFLSK